MTTGPKTVDVELTHELVALRAAVRPDSELLTRLEAASRMQRVKPLGGIHFWFTGTEAEAYALLDLAAARAPTAVLESSRGSWRRAPEPERRPRPRAFPFRSS
jgi:hypothetical protein